MIKNRRTVGNPSPGDYMGSPAASLMRCYKHLQDQQTSHAHDDCQQDVFCTPGHKYREYSRHEPDIPSSLLSIPVFLHLQSEADSDANQCRNGYL